MSEFTMPSLGADMDEGTLVEWLVEPGDEVHRGQVIAVVDTAKADIEVECFDDGRIDRLLVEPGETVPVGTPLALISPDGAPGPAAADLPEPPAPPIEVPEKPAGPQTPSTPTPAAPPPAPAGRPVLPPSLAVPPRVSSPLVRHFAEAEGVDLAGLRGTGRGGTITRTDVERAAVRHATQKAARPRITPLARRLAAELGADLKGVAGSGSRGTIRAVDVRGAATRPAIPAPAPAEPAETDHEDRQAAMRRAIGRLMARSKREIPHYYVSTTIDSEPALSWLRDRNRELPVARRLLPAALLLKASALAARQVPELNGYWIDDGFVPGEAVHLGVAISLRGGGLVTPALRDAGSLPLDELMAALKDVVARARGGRLRGSELTGGTLTVTNLGERGVETVAGVIYPPQVALVGFGKVVERPWAVGGLLGVRRLVTVTLAADHRATDGYTGARYLDVLTRLLHRPEEL